MALKTLKYTGNKWSVTKDGLLMIERYKKVNKCKIQQFTWVIS